jgi:hypothetical protein
MARNIPEVQEAIEAGVNQAVLDILNCAWGPLDEGAFNALHGIEKDGVEDATSED